MRATTTDTDAGRPVLRALASAVTATHAAAHDASKAGRDEGRTQQACHGGPATALEPKGRGAEEAIARVGCEGPDLRGGRIGGRS